jgi:hypothetical protein
MLGTRAIVMNILLEQRLDTPTRSYKKNGQADENEKINEHTRVTATTDNIRAHAEHAQSSMNILFEQRLDTLTRGYKKNGQFDENEKINEHTRVTATTDKIRARSEHVQSP